MQTHGPNILEGPVTWERDWWPRPEEAPPGDAAPSPLDPDIRTDLVERVRREIAAGTYETPEKWDIALRRLLDETDRLYDGE